MTERMEIPQSGRHSDDVIGSIEQALEADVDWRGGKVFSLVYHAGAEHEQLLKNAHSLSSSANLLNPMAFKGLRQLEAQVIDMVASLFHGPDTTVGSVTSGGTESILVAMHAYRERARKHKRWIRNPEIVLPRTAHPAFDKAAHYFGLKLRKTEVIGDMSADVRAMARKIGRNTIALVASAPQYPHGVIDPIGEIGALAQKNNLPFHVDACVGGFILPWIERLGRDIPPWDFRVPGVTSISADLHKYAYAAKGASTLTWRSMDDMKHQFFIATDFPGGIYASPTLLGTRPGGPVAAAWAALTSLGVEGYLKLAAASLEAADGLRDGIRQIPELEVVGNSQVTLVAWRALPGGPDTFAIADRLEARGWTVDRQHRPVSVHLTLTANHLEVVEEYLSDLRGAVRDVVDDPSLVDSGTVPMYGMMAKSPVRGMIESTVRGVLASMYAPGAKDTNLESVGGDGAVGKLIDRYGPEINRALGRLQDLRARLKIGNVV